MIRSRGAEKIGYFPCAFKDFGSGSFSLLEPISDADFN